MALYEYYCDACAHRFEQITSSTDPDAGKCPKCQKKEARKLISLFRVAGRGDLRESTMHGCHGGCSHHHPISPSAPASEAPSDAATTPASAPSTHSSAE